MAVETVISLPDQFAIEAPFTEARFISRYKQDRLAFGIKSKSHSPFTVCRAESQLLHVRMTGVFERPKLLQHDRQRQNLRLHVAMQRVELRLKFVGHLNGPPHPLNMVQSTYDTEKSRPENETSRKGTRRGPVLRRLRVEYKIDVAAMGRRSSWAHFVVSYR